MAVIEKSYVINASAEDVFEALVNPELIQIWSGDEAKMSADIGAEFKLWGGQMFGKNLEVIPNKKLVQEWCYEQWNEPSKVIITIKSKGKSSVVTLAHEDVPDKSFNSISDGWDTFYFGAIQDMLEKGNKNNLPNYFQHNTKNVF
jgi:activator of HSP90 ATPase